MMPAGTEVEIAGPEGHLWTAVVAQQEADDAGVLVRLTSQDDGPICSGDCGLLPVGERSLLRTLVVLVPETHGLVVPAAAVWTKADGSAVLLDAAGGEHSVTVEASAKGMTVVAGVEPGLQVRVPAQS